MITKEQKLRLGIFLAVSLLLLAAILAVFIAPRLQEEGDTYFINFKKMSVNGVNEGSDVKYQGVRIGNVSSMNVNPEDLSSIMVYVNIRKGFPVKKDMRAKLQYAGITGMRFVEISGGTTQSESLLPGSEIPMGKGLGEKAEDIVLNVDSVVEAVNNILNKENQDRIAALLTNIEKSTGVLARVLGKNEKNLQNLFANISQSSAELKNIAVEINQVSQRFALLMERIDFEKIAAESNRMIGNISDRFSPQEFGEYMKNFNTFVQTSTTSIKRIEGSVRDLETELDRTLSSLRVSLENIAKFTRDLAEDPTILIRTRSDKRSNE